MDLAERTRITFKFEKRRAVANGILETAGSTFLLLSVVRGFEGAGPVAKALVAGAASMGLLVSPMVVSAVQASRWPAAMVASRMAAVGAVIFFLMATVPWLPVFVAGSIVAMSCSTSAIPLLTQIFRDNYPAKRRGHFFSRAVLFRVGTAALFSFMAGWILSSDGEGLGRYRGLWVVFGLAFLFSGLCLSRLPSRPLVNDAGGHPFRSLRFAREDRLFGHALFCWMLMGFGNLMMIPLRVEYLANPNFGLEYSELRIALLTLVVPNIFRFILNPLWGKLFDRMNFFLLRSLLNLFFATGIWVFFHSESLAGLLFGAVFFGISSAGGDIAWGLWVTKLAPPRRVAQYMSVHTFFTGLRGVCAPLVGFTVLASGLAIGMVAGVSVLLILLSAVLLAPAAGRLREQRPTQAVTEEISE